MIRHMGSQPKSFDYARIRLTSRPLGSHSTVLVTNLDQSMILRNYLPLPEVGNCLTSDTDWFPTGRGVPLETQEIYLEAIH